MYSPALDLHLHTTASDGLMTPEETVEEAARCGMDVIAITDHDTVDGIPGAKRAAQKMPLTVIAGVELNIAFPTELHMLGLEIDPENRKLRDTLDAFAQRRRDRAREIVERLDALGCPISMEDVMDRAEGTSVGRGHIASVLVAEGYAEDTNAAFARYLEIGKPAYVPYRRMDFRQGIELIHQADGAAIWAHPVKTFTDQLKLRVLYEELKEAGLDGIECYHPSADGGWSSLFRRWCSEDRLLITGGSDWHAREFSRPIGWPAQYYDVEACIPGASERIRQKQRFLERKV